MKIVIKKFDGSVAIMTLLAEAAQAFEFDPETVVRAEIAAWTPEAQAAVVSWRAMPDEAIPEDRTFRAAWVDTTEALVVDVDMPKAREVWRNKMRAARAPKLEALDVGVVRLIESGKPHDANVAEKQELRDVTKHPGIEAAKTTDELKRIWPAILG